MAIFNRLARDESGNVAVVFALALIPLFGAVGALIDYTRVSNLRAEVAAAIDAGLLAVGSQPPMSDQQAFDTVNKWLETHIKPTYQGNWKLDSVVQQKGGKITATVSGAIDTTIAKVLGVQSIPISVTSEIVSAVGKVEVAMVLDNTGSMATKNKIGKLKDAAEALVDTLAKAVLDPSDLKIGLVPFSQTVNVGPNYKDAAWLDKDGKSDSAKSLFLGQEVNRLDLFKAMGTTWGSWDSFESDRDVQGRLLREALEAIGPGDSPFRAQLLASLAQILYFSGGLSADARAMAIEATEMAERVNDPYTFFVSNIAASFLRWEPEGRASRLPMADRLVEVAESSEDPEDLAEALSWRAVVQLNLGHRAEADADIARFDVLARTLPQIRVNQAGLHSSQMVLEGRWDEAEQLITETIQQDIPTAARVALTDSLLFEIRAEQGRLDEHLDHVKAMAAQSSGWEHWPTWRMAYYLAMTQAGRGDEVLERVDRYTDADVLEIESRNITYLSFCALASMVACEIGFERGAATLVGLMEPYAGEWVITGPAGSTLGPVEMHLGEICLLLGRDRDAATWLERSVDTCEEMGARPYLAHSRMHLALALRRIGNPEPGRAEELMESGREIAEELGMAMLLDRIANWT